jgi:chemotaxis family two-component system sensor kinase Cph1
VQICAADGAAVLIDGAVELIGETPPAEAVRALVAAVGGAGAAFVSGSLGSDLPELSDSLAPSCGAIVLALGRAGDAHLAWFRNEYVRSVTWGDNGLAPAKGRLSPTGSYATWSESVTGASRPWSAIERDMVVSLRAGIGTVVLAQAEALAHANQELARSNADLEAFTFVIAHDLREPLRNMQSFLGFFLEDHGADLDSDGAEQLDTVRRLGIRMNALMDSLLDHARAERLKPELIELPLSEVVSDAVGMLGPDSSRGAVELLTPEVRIRADRDAMMHILLNLITNAVKYSPGDAPRIEISARPADPRHPGAVGPPMVIVGVQDFGIGVAEEFSEAIFELFRRLHARDAYGGGSGAGLAIARRLAQRQGGELWLEASVPGEGSRFCFSVPGV